MISMNIGVRGAVVKRSEWVIQLENLVRRVAG